jgi:hypothetical protein
MTDFQLDTSGTVGEDTWADLEPMMCGYIATALEDFTNESWANVDAKVAPISHLLRSVAFYDLSAETLATMKQECAHFANVATGLGIKKIGETEGRRFWTGRQNGFPGVYNPVWNTAYPPVILSLDAEGKIYQTYRK